MTRDHLVVPADRSIGVPPTSMPEAEAIRSAAYAAYGLAEGPEDCRLQIADCRLERQTVPIDNLQSAICNGESAALAAQLAAEITGSLGQAQHAVLEAARQMLLAYQRQQAARAVANGAENEWMVACFSSGREQTRAANRTRRAALRSHEQAWHDYQARAQHLCKATEWLVELEALADEAALSRADASWGRR